MANGEWRIGKAPRRGRSHALQASEACFPIRHSPFAIRLYFRHPMNRIDTRFAALRASGRAGLIPFITAGDPTVDATLPVMHALVAAGADLIEVGVPFSDPMADGPVIQRASERALARGVGLRRVLEIVAAFRRDDATTPVVLMGYLNPLEIYGYERFANDAHAAGVDGVLMVDSPIEEAGELTPLLARHGIEQIFLAAPTTAQTRLSKVIERARGFLYYVSFAGITGADKLALGDIGASVQAIRAATRTPVAVGFGIKDPQQAAAIADFADAVVIGSALVERLGACADADAAALAARTFLAPIRAALDAARSRDAA
jgi:tryptophan synthase alpha chain